MARVTLTFDNGPDLKGTPYVRSVLAERDILTTFFVVGERLRDRRRRNLAEECHAGGHWIGNHTLSHGAPLGLDRREDAPEIEIGEAQRRIGDLAHPMRLFRPHNRGLLSPSLLSARAVSALQAGRFTLVIWNVVPGDWLDAVGWPERALEELEGRASALIVLHDTEHDAMRRLPGFLDRLGREGHEIVQDFPEDCVPIRCGELVGDLSGLVTPEPG